MTFCALTTQLSSGGGHGELEVTETKLAPAVCCSALFGGIACALGSDYSSFPTRASGLQLPTLEFLPSRPEVAQMVNRRPRRREREGLKLLVEHLLQVILGGEPDRDVWIEFLAGPVGHEL